MSERSKETVLKTVEVQASASSNLALPASIKGLPKDFSVSPFPCRLWRLSLSWRQRHTIRRSAAQRVSSERFDSCSLRSTELIWVSTVLMEMNSSEATSLYV